MNSILINLILLFFNESSVSNVFTHVFEKNNASEKINAFLFTKVNTSSDENSLINLIVVRNDQLWCSTAKDSETTRVDDQVRDTQANFMLKRKSERRFAIQTWNDEDADEKIVSILRFAHEESEANFTQDTSIVFFDDLLFKCSICQRDVSSQRSRNKNKFVNFHQQIAFCKNHQMKDVRLFANSLTQITSSIDEEIFSSLRYHK